MRAADESAFEQFVAARSDDLLRLAVLLAADRGHAEDLVQTALVKAYRRWGRIAGEDPYPYVRRVLVAERQHMADAMDGLPPRMRAVLALRYAEDLSEAATAEALGISVSTVRSQTVRGLARLRTVLAAERPAVLEEC